VETIPGHLQRLPAGQDRFQAEQLSRDQRDRILAAMAQVVAKRGYQGTTIEHIVKRAGVSRATFYENFANREECLLAGFAAALAEARRRIDAAAAGAEEWPDQVRAAIFAFLDYAASEPALARTCLVESMTAGPVAMEHYEQALQSFAPLFHRGRELLAGEGELPETLEDSIVGGIVWMIHQRLLRGEAAAIPALLPTTLAFALGPYLGEERAAEFAAAARV
jgi:AcrR family transcriptional regulator